MEQISTVRGLIDLWETRKVLADEVGVSADRVHKWAQVGSIPARYHWKVLEAAARRGLTLSADDIVRLHAAPPKEAAA